MAKQLFVIEARDAAGNIDRSPANAPPWASAGLPALYDYYYANADKAVDVSESELFEWYKQRGWHIRARNW